MPTKIYISGKIFGYPTSKAKEYFKRAENYINRLPFNYEAINPFSFDIKNKQDYIDFREKEIPKCKEIFMLQGFRNCELSIQDYKIAKKNKLRIFYDT